MGGTPSLPALGEGPIATRVVRSGADAAAATAAAADGAIDGGSGADGCARRPVFRLPPAIELPTAIELPPAIELPTAIELPSAIELPPAIELPSAMLLEAQAEPRSCMCGLPSMETRCGGAPTESVSAGSAGAHANTTRFGVRNGGGTSAPLVRTLHWAAKALTSPRDVTRNGVVKASSEAEQAAAGDAKVLLEAAAAGVGLAPPARHSREIEGSAEDAAPAGGRRSGASSSSKPSVSYRDLSFWLPSCTVITFDSC